MCRIPKEFASVWVGINAEPVQQEIRLPVDEGDAQIMIELSRLITSRFRWKPSGHIMASKKVVDLGAKGVDKCGEQIFDCGRIGAFMLSTS